MQPRGDGTGGRERRGERTIVTLEDVARAAGVHYSTVSRALDPISAAQVKLETRTRLQAVAKRMGYQRDMVASGLKRGRTHTVAVIAGDLGNPNLAPVLRGIASGLEQAGLMTLISETRFDSARLDRIVKHLMSRRVDAIIMTSARPRDAPTLRWIRRQGIPLVLAIQTVPGVRLPACTNDDHLGGVLAARHLLSLGHRRFAQLRGPMEFSSCLLRAQGFTHTVAAAGAEEIMVESTALWGSPESGAALMRELLDKRGVRPTGIFAHHDLTAFGALTMAEERGLMCPRDLSMVGYHNLPHDDRIAPPLTSIGQPRQELGRTAAEILIAVLTKPGRMPAPRLVQPSLVVRKSTGPPPEPR